MGILSVFRNRKLCKNICRTIAGISIVMPGINSPIVAEAAAANEWGYGTASGTGKNNVVGTSNAFSYSDIDKSKNFWVQLSSAKKDNETGDNVYYVHVAEATGDLATGDYLVYKNYTKYPDTWVPGDSESGGGYWVDGGYKSDASYYKITGSDTESIMNAVLGNGNSYSNIIQNPDGTITIKTDVTINGDGKIDGDLDVGGDGNIKGDLTVDGNEHVKGDGTTDGNQTIGKDLTVGGNGTIDGDLLVKGNETVNGDSHVNGDLTVDGNGSFGGNLDVKGDGNFDGNLDVGGDGHIKGDLTVDGNENLKGDLVIGGNIKGDTGADGSSSVDINSGFTPEGDITTNIGSNDNIGDHNNTTNIGSGNTGSGNTIIDAGSRNEGDTYFNIGTKNEGDTSLDIATDNKGHVKTNYGSRNEDGVDMTIGSANKGDTNMIMGSGNKDGNTNIIMGSNNDNGDTLVAIGKGNTNGKTTIDIGDIGNNTTVNVSGDSVNITGGNSINMAAPEVNIKGDLNVNGTITADDAIIGGKSVKGEFSRIEGRVNATGAHAAALAALHPGEWDEDTKLSVSAGMGAYSGSKAMALGAFYRPTDKIMFSIGGTTGGSENMMNLGVTFGLDANPHAPRSTKKEMTQDIVALKAENEVLKDDISSIKAQLDQLLKALNVKEIQKWLIV